MTLFEFISYKYAFPDPKGWLILNYLHFIEIFPPFRAGKTKNRRFKLIGDLNGHPKIILIARLCKEFLGLNNQKTIQFIVATLQTPMAIKRYFSSYFKNGLFMSLRELNKRTTVCELCGNEHDLKPFVVIPRDEDILACNLCSTQIEHPDEVDVNHWRCLNDSMWSTQPAVQVVAWRMLTRLKAEGWPQDLLDMMYLEDDTLEWAKASGDHIEEDENTIIHKDSNGTRLSHGDSVVLIKDLDVKGANFTAKRGEFMRNIFLVHDNAEHIEGRIQGQQVVIVTKYVKKSN